MFNIVIYLKSGKQNHKFYTGFSGYTYDIEKVSKKKLVKKSPTTNGYCINPNVNMKGVDIENMITGYSVNYKNGLDCLLNGIITILNEFKDNNLYKNMIIITKSLAISQIIKLGHKQIINKNYVVNKTELNKELIDVLFNIIESYDDRRILFNNEEWAEGGEGVLKATEICGLCATLCNTTNDIKNVIDLTSLKQYNDPNTDFNKVINGNRWYFVSGALNRYYDLYKGYRRYFFGKVEKDKKYYGKLTPDVTYSVLYIKESISHLDKIRDYTVNSLPDDNGLLYAGIIPSIKNKGVIRLLDILPGIVEGNKILTLCSMGNQEDPVLVELINPPGLSFQITDNHNILESIIQDYLNDKKEFKYHDITNVFYKTEVNGKGVTKLTLTNDIKQETKIIKVKAYHEGLNKELDYILTIGTDTPTRINLNSIDDVDVKLFLVVDESNKKGVHFYTLLVTKDLLYSTMGGTNIKIFNLKELEVDI